jgi:hypothetical protein
MCRSLSSSLTHLDLALDRSVNDFGRLQLFSLDRAGDDELRPARGPTWTLGVTSLIVAVFILGCSVDSKQTESNVSCDPSELAPLEMIEVSAKVEGALLGVWSPRATMAETRTWFVGGHKDADGQLWRLIATHAPASSDDEDTARTDGGVIKLHTRAQGAPLWWVWGSGAIGHAWSSGEAGTILRLDQDTWREEMVHLPESLRERAVIWGVWGPEGGHAEWAVGGSVRRGGPKGLLLRRGEDGEWRRVLGGGLPIEDPEDPIKGLNLYKIWGRQDGATTQLWAVGEGGVTLTWSVSADDAPDEHRVSVNDLYQLPESDRALLFTVHDDMDASLSSDKEGPFAVGGYDKGVLWSWTSIAHSSSSPSSSTSGQWTSVSLPPLPLLNGLSVGPRWIYLVGHMGAIARLSRCDLSLDSTLDPPALTMTTDHSWVSGAESSTLHAVWHEGERMWAVGGDLEKMSDGVIITTLDPAPTLERWP